MKHVFIGGTGRSGTSILQHVLSFHPQLYVIPIETKFIVQTDGLFSLLRYLTHDYSITDSSIALARFKTLMYDVITHRGANPYAGFAGQPYGRLEFLPQDLFTEYWKKLGLFFGQVNDKYYSRTEAINIASNFVDGMFRGNVEARSADGWVEKTPSNLFRIEFLFEMFPDALFINCVRDPRGVLDSFLRKEWLTGNLTAGAEYLVSYYEYVAEKRTYGRNKAGQYCEMRLERMVADPIGEIGNLLEFLNVAPFNQEKNESLLQILREGSVRWDEARQKYCDTWETAFSSEDRKSVNAILANVIAAYGYEL